MKKILALFLIIFIMPIPSEIHAEAKLHGIWIATAANLDYPSRQTLNDEELRSEADKILDDCNSLGINAVFFQVRPSGDAFYPSILYPWSHYLTGTQETAPENNFDVLDYWINSAHSRGIELHAWINPYRVASDASLKLAENNPAKQHPEWVIKYKNGLYLDPGIPDAKNYVIEGVKEIVKNYNVDGIHFDDYFYPGKDFDDSRSYADYGMNTNKDNWRRSNTDSLIRETGEAVHYIKKNVVFGVSPCGIWANRSVNENGSDTNGTSAYYDMYADTLKWAKEGYVDYIAPQIYWYTGFKAADYTVLSQWWQSQLSNSDTKLYIGLGDYRMDKFGSDSSSPWFEGNELLRQMQANASSDGIDGEIHFRYGSIKNHQILYDKIKNEYSQYSDIKEENTIETYCLYIYYNRFGIPIYTKNVRDTFNITICRCNAPSDTDYAEGIFIDKNGEWKHECVKF